MRSASVYSPDLTSVFDAGIVILIVPASASTTVMLPSSRLTLMTGTPSRRPNQRPLNDDVGRQGHRLAVTTKNVVVGGHALGCTRYCLDAFRKKSSAG